MSYFLYRLIPPRPTFAMDMTAAEQATMGRHAAYWQAHLEEGRVVVFGPVADPDGTWGMAVLEVEGEAGAVALGEEDPAVSSGMATFAVHAMPMTSVRS